jgi:hypothetical protein
VENDRFEELSWSFLLWGLSDPEQAEWEAELERRGEAGRVELARMREAVASLALAAPPAQARSGLRERLLAWLETAGEGVAGPAGFAADAARLRRSSTTGPAGVPRVPRRPWEWIAAAAIAAGLAGLLAVWNVGLRDELKNVRAQLAEAERRLATADSARVELEAARRDLEALGSPAASVHTLVGTAERPAARARVFVDPATRRAILFVYDLPVLPPQTVYELWAIKGGKPVAAGTFSPTDPGRARVELEDVAPLQGADALAVTVEPAPGGTAPTGKLVLSSARS